MLRWVRLKMDSRFRGNDGLSSQASVTLADEGMTVGPLLNKFLSCQSHSF